MFKVTMRGTESVQAFIKSIPRGAVKTGLHAFTEYIIGDERHGLKHYEPYKYVHPFRSYSSDPVKAAKQRGWIFTHLDQIGHNNRTRKTAEGWKFKETNNGYGATIENSEKGAKWLWSDTQQTRQHEAVGHKTLSEKIADNYLGAVRAAVFAVNKWLKGKK